jgi:hypothetical protein
MSSKSCKTVNTPREIGCISLETSTSPFYVSTRGMAVGSLGNSLVSSLVAKISILGTLSLFLLYHPRLLLLLYRGLSNIHFCLLLRFINNLLL